MSEQYSWKARAIVTFMLHPLFRKLGGAAAPGCKLLSKAAWVALGLLRSVILLADWQAVSAYLWDDSRHLQHLLQIMASLWSLICFVAG
jgi:hypothetical protein